MTRLPDESISFQNTTGDSGVENLYVYGQLNYSFEKDDLKVKSINVSENATFTGAGSVATTATGVLFSVGDGGSSGDRVIQFKRATRSTDINIQAVNSGTGATNLLFNQEGGAASFGGNVSLGDSKYLNIGAGSDLKLSHDTNNSIIANSTGE